MPLRLGKRSNGEHPVNESTANKSEVKVQTLPGQHRTGHLAPGFLGSTAHTQPPRYCSRTAGAPADWKHENFPADSAGHLVTHPWVQLSEVSPSLEKESALMRIVWGHRDDFRQDRQVSPVTSHGHQPWSLLVSRVLPPSYLTSGHLH